MWHGGQEIWSGSGREFDDLFGTEYSVQLGHCPAVTVLPQRPLQRLGTSNLHVHSYGFSPYSVLALYFRQCNWRSPQPILPSQRLCCHQDCNSRCSHFPKISQNGNRDPCKPLVEAARSRNGVEYVEGDRHVSCNVHSLTSFHLKSPPLFGFRIFLLHAPANNRFVTPYI